MTLTMDEALDILIKQNGCCYYSGVILTYGGYKEADWCISLERKDVTKGYTAENCVFVSVEFNGTDRSVTRNGATSAGWTVEKFEYFVAVARQKYSL